MSEQAMGNNIERSLAVLVTHAREEMILSSALRRAIKDIEDSLILSITPDDILLTEFEMSIGDCAAIDLGMSYQDAVDALSRLKGNMDEETTLQLLDLKDRQAKEWLRKQPKCSHCGCPRDPDTGDMGREKGQR